MAGTRQVYKFYCRDCEYFFYKLQDIGLGFSCPRCEKVLVKPKPMPAEVK